MLSREDFYMIKQMRQQGAYIVDIATQVGCSERTVRRYLKYPEPPARKTRHKMAKLKPFIDRNLNPQKIKKPPRNGCFFNTLCAPDKWQRLLNRMTPIDTGYQWRFFALFPPKWMQL
ncbi:TPA: hypothetical protein ACOX9D_004858, partial [Escherichia coli]